MGQSGRKAQPAERAKEFATQTREAAFNETGYALALVAAAPSLTKSTIFVTHVHAPAAEFVLLFKARH